jgi:sulfite exporter TauE/SafE
MIRTIGSLVQETSTRKSWLFAATLYTIACTSTAVLLGICLSSIGLFLPSIFHIAGKPFVLFSIGQVLIGGLAIAYALSDSGLIRLPRPKLMKAVPVTWWRWWRPYGASIAYGAALGLGVMTRVHFGAFYILCLWCMFQGEPVYGAMLMATYGLARALTLFPSSWYVYNRRTDTERCLSRLSNGLENARIIIAFFLILFGIFVIGASFPAQPH